MTFNFHQFIKDPIDGLFLLFLSVFVLSIGAKIFFWFLEKFLKKTKLCAHNFSVSKVFLPPVLILILIFAMKFFVPLFDIETVIKSNLDKFFMGLININLAWIGIKMVNFLKQSILSQFTEDKFKYRKMATQLDFLARIATFIIVIIALFATLMIFGEAKKLSTSLLASAGLASIIIGLAAQKTLGELLSGFQIAFTQPIRIDDTVSINGETGIVEEISLTYIVLKTWDLRKVIIPISYLLTNPIQNFTRVSDRTIGYFDIYADYSLSVDSLREEFNRLLQNNPLWDGKVSSLGVNDATEKSLQIRITVSAKNSSEAGDLKGYLRENLIKFIQQNHPESLPKVRIEKD